MQAPLASHLSEDEGALIDGGPKTSDVDMYI